MINYYVRLKGFRGVLAGLGLQEVSINFITGEINQPFNPSAIGQPMFLPKGLIFFSGPNGSSKTTLLDCLTPYRMMGSRMNSRDSDYRPSAFSFYDHVFGDFEKENIIEMEGNVYRCLIQGAISVNSKGNESRETDAYLQIWNGEKWVPVPGTTSKTGPYDKAVDEIFGSSEMTFVSHFRAQSAKAMSDYTAGTMQDIFMELLGLGYPLKIGERAARVRKAVAGKIELLQFEKGKLRDTIGKEEDFKKQVEQIEVDQAGSTYEVDRLTKQAGEIQTQINECDVKIKTQESAIGGKAEIEKDLLLKRTKLSETRTARSTKESNLSSRIIGLESKVRLTEANIKDIPRLRNMQAEKADTEKRIEEVKTSAKNFEDQQRATNQSINNLLVIDGQIKEKEKELQGIVQRRKHEAELCKLLLDEAKKQAAKLGTVPCSEATAAGCRFVKDAVLAKESIPELERKYADAQIEDPRIATLKVEIEDKKTGLKDLPSLRKNLADIENSQRNIRSDLDRYEKLLAQIIKSLEALPRLELEEQKLPEIRTELDQAKKEKDNALAMLDFEIGDIEADVQDLKDRAALIEVDPEIQQQKERLQTALRETTEATETKRTEQAELSKKLGAIEEALRQIETAKASMITTNQRIDFLNDEIAVWTVLEKGLGKDGVPKLEVDDAGPQVSSIANELLASLGGRFSIRIDTQSEKAGKGGQNEDFRITVFDNETNWVGPLKTEKSGGERAWIEDCITRAIGIYNKSADGKEWKTAFGDEKDGAMDPQKKKEYFAVKRKVLDLGGYDREFCITQTPALMDMADAVIYLNYEQGQDGLVQKKGSITIQINN